MWNEILTEIQSVSGMSEKAIAEAVSEQSVTVAQSSINRIKHGLQEPSYSVGARLIELHKRIKAKAKRSVA